MPGLDGLYEYASTTTTWDDSGLVVRRGADRERIAWSAFTGVRIRRSELSGQPSQSVQLVPRQRAGLDGTALLALSIPVRSEADANRLVMTFEGHVQGPGLTLDDVV